MKRQLITPATFRPLEVEATKIRPELKIDGDEDNLVIADLISSAIEAFEEYTNQVLCRSTWDLYLDAFPKDGPIEIPAPLAAVASVSYVAAGGALQTVDKAGYKVGTAGELAGTISLRAGAGWPSTAQETDSVVVRYDSGWENAAAIPQLIKDGMYLKIKQLYDGSDTEAAYHACWKRWKRTPI